jgi:hypothetical protein
MTTPGAELAPRSPRGLSRTAGAAIGFVALSLLVGRLILNPAHLRYVVALTAIVTLLGLGTRSPRLLLLGAVLWLTSLGFVRRLLSEVGSASHLDPLLVVGPLALGVLVLVAAQRGAFAVRTRLSRAVFVLSVLILLGSVNPLQGSLFGGISGLLFVLVPTFGFWVGRSLDDRAIEPVFMLLAVLGVAVAAYGLIQTVAGFPPWDKHWIDQVNFASLNVSGVVRPFATFSSAAEFAAYTSVAIMICIAAASRIKYLPLAAAALALLIPALILESSRGFVVLIVVALGVMLGARRRLPLLLAAGLGAVLLFGLAFGLRSYGPATYARSASGTLISHDISGLSDPLNPQTSTASSHLSLLLNGVKTAFTHPVGRGIGSVTIAGSTFGGVTASTEADPSNMAVALGLPGLLAYVAVFVMGIQLVYTKARMRRDLPSLIALGIVVVTLFQWLNGGLYSVAFLPWLALGWADRTEEPRQ